MRQGHATAVPAMHALQAVIACVPGNAVADPRGVSQQE